MAEIIWLILIIITAKYRQLHAAAATKARAHTQSHTHTLLFSGSANNDGLHNVLFERDVEQGKEPGQLAAITRKGGWGYNGTGGEEERREEERRTNVNGYTPRKVVQRAAENRAKRMKIRMSVNGFCQFGTLL